MTTPSSSTRGSLCRACGFCCDGTLFGRGTLAADELENARSHGLRILADDAACFTQPCAGHAGDHCAIYDARPGCCRAFRCALLDDVERAHVDRARAEALVERVRELGVVIRAATPSERDEPLFTVARRLAEDADSADWRRANADLLLDLAELTMLCRRHFGARDDGSL